MDDPKKSSQPRLLLRVPEVAEVLALSRSKVYELIGAGLPAIHIGRATRVPLAALRKWMEEQENKSDSM